MTEEQGTQVITLLTDSKSFLEKLVQLLPFTNTVLGGIFVALLGILFFTAMRAVRRDV